MNRRIRGPAVAAVAAATPAVAGVAVPAAPARALPLCKGGYQCTWWYYSDVTYTTLVGSAYRFCDGSSSTLGDVTGYVRVENDGPCVHSADGPGRR